MLLMVASLVAATLPMPGEAEAKRFDELFERAEALYSRGDYGAAITLFREADRLKVTSEVAYDLARSYEKLGDLAFTSMYDRLSVARAPEAADAKDILTRVQRTLDRAEDEGVGLLEVSASAASRLVIAGRAFPAAPVALFLPAGEYVVEGAFPDGLHSTTVKVRSGRVSPVWFEPARPPLVAAEVSAPRLAVDARVEAPTTPAAGPSPTRIASFVALGVGALALGAGLALGATSNADAARVQDKSLTVREARAFAAEANGKASAANVLFAVGGIATATGGLLFIVSLPSPGEPGSAK